MLFFCLRFLVASFVSFSHCIVCYSFVYGFSLPLQYLLVIVLYVILQFTVSRCLFSSFYSLYCLLFFCLRLLVASFVYFIHCIVCYSLVYGLSLPLQYLLFIVLYVIPLFTVSCCLFSIFFSLYCLLLFCLRFLVASLVYFSHCIVCYSLVYGFSLSLQNLLFIVLYVILQLTVSRCLFSNFYSLYCLLFFCLRLLVASFVSFIHCIVCYSLVYGFSLPLQYLLFIALHVILLFTFSRFLFSIFQSLYCLLFFCLRLLVASLVSFSHCIVCYSLAYGFSLPLQQLLFIVLFVILLFTASRCLFCIFQSLYCMLFFSLRFVVASLVSFIHCIVCYSFVYGFLLPLQYLLFIVLYVNLLFTPSRCLFSIFYSLYFMLFFCLRFLVASLVYFIHCIVCYSFVYCFSLPLQYLLFIVLYVILLFTVSRCLFSIFYSLY